MDRKKTIMKLKLKLGKISHHKALTSAPGNLSVSDQPHPHDPPPGEGINGGHECLQRVLSGPTTDPPSLYLEGNGGHECLQGVLSGPTTDPPPGEGINGGHEMPVGNN